ncbi:MAG: PEP-CTERM sorting domain-containing protein [Planctomycetota bacterium]
MAALLAAATMTPAAKADLLLTVDLSVINQITITATDGLSEITTSGSDTTGVYLDLFYGAGVAGGGLGDSTLVAGDLTSFLNTSDGSPLLFRSTFPDVDTGLNLFTFTDDLDAEFVAGTQAFSGSATYTLNADDYSDMLLGNTSGDVYFPADSDDDITGLTPLGTWEVVGGVIPEPTTFALSAIGLIGLGGLRRRS